MKKLSILAAMMVVVAGVALAATLNVPFFIDSSTNGTTGVSGFIGLKDTSGSAQVLTIVYTGLNQSTVPQNQTVTFALGANQSIKWSPVQDLGASEGTGSAVPNMNITGPNGQKQIGGSAKIISAGSIAGMYQQVNFTRSSDMSQSLPN